MIEKDLPRPNFKAAVTRETVQKIYEILEACPDIFTHKGDVINTAINLLYQEIKPS